MLQGIADAEINVPSAENRQLSEVSLLKPGWKAAALHFMDEETCDKNEVEWTEKVGFTEAEPLAVNEECTVVF